MSQLSFFEATPQLSQPSTSSIALAEKGRSPQAIPDSQPSPSPIAASKALTAYSPQHPIAAKRKGQTIETLAIDPRQGETPSTFVIEASLALPCCDWLSGGTH